MLAARFSGYRPAYARESVGAEIEIATQTRFKVLDSNSFGNWLVKYERSITPNEVPPAFYFYNAETRLRVQAEQGSCEVVTQPLSYAKLVREIVWLYASLGGTICVNKTCGLHFHVSRKAVGFDQICKLKALLQRLDTGRLIHLAGRDRVAVTDEDDFDSGYSLLSVTKPNTYEFRLWAAAHDAVTALKYLRRTRLLCAYQFRKSFPLQADNCTKQLAYSEFHRLINFIESHERAHPITTRGIESWKA